MNAINSKSRPIKLAHSQQGAVLILSLIILLVMTLFGLASMNTSIMQEKMAANSQNTNRTFQAAESAVGAVVDEVLGGWQVAGAVVLVGGAWSTTRTDR